MAAPGAFRAVQDAVPHALRQVTDRGIWDPAFEDALALPARDTPLPPSEVRGGRRVRPYLAEVGRD